MEADPPPRSSSATTTIDPRSGYCSKTKVFHSLRQPVELPPQTQPLSVASHAFSFLSWSSSSSAFVDSATSRSLSFSQLRSQVRSLSASLLSPPLSLSRGHLAFVLSPSRLEVPVLYFSLLSVGIIVSPSNPASSPQEISHQFLLTNPTVAFATSSTSHLLPAGFTNVVLLDSPFFHSLLFQDDRNNSTTRSVASSGSCAEKINQSDTAAVLYSSGTTGPVKAVVLTHRNLIAQITAIKSVQRPRPTDFPSVQMLTVPLFHVYGFVFCLKAIAVPETVVLMTERFKVGRVLDAVERFRVTNLTASPPLVHAIVGEMGGSACGRVRRRESRNYNISSLEGVSCGGAPIAEATIRFFASCFPNVSLTQGYGLTESTAGIFRSVGTEESRQISSCGRLMSNYLAKIIEPTTGTALSPNEQGELLIRGPSIMKGYLGDQEATDAVLDTEGWLKTGDLCYIDNDGFLFVVDRLKELIKYKGYQVPPAELEHLLHAHPDIVEAAVVPYPDEEAGQVPMAFVVGRKGKILDRAAIMDYISRQVAPYKKIRRVVFVNSIPKNAAGKILRKDLMKRATSYPDSKL